MSSTVLDVQTVLDAQTDLDIPGVRGHSTQARRPQGGTVRLTGRGRLAILLTAAVAALGVAAERGGPAESTSVVNHPRLSTVVVTPGQTVWDIARTVSGDADPRAVVAQIEELNSLSDAGSIRVGQPLYVPRG